MGGQSALVVTDRGRQDPLRLGVMAPGDQDRRVHAAADGQHRPDVPLFADDRDPVAPLACTVEIANAAARAQQLAAGEGDSQRILQLPGAGCQRRLVHELEALLDPALGDEGAALQTPRRHLGVEGADLRCKPARGCQRVRTCIVERRLSHVAPGMIGGGRQAGEERGRAGRPRPCDGGVAAADGRVPGQAKRG